MCWGSENIYCLLKREKWKKIYSKKGRKKDDEDKDDGDADEDEDEKRWWWKVKVNLQRKWSKIHEMFP